MSDQAEVIDFIDKMTALRVALGEDWTAAINAGDGPLAATIKVQMDRAMAMEINGRQTLITMINNSPDVAALLAKLKQLNALIKKTKDDYAAHTAALTAVSGALDSAKKFLDGMS